MSWGAPETRARLETLADRYDLHPDALSRLSRLVERLVDDPHAPTSIRDPEMVVERHVADSLVALELEPVRQAILSLDLGSGAGIPGLPLAAVLPAATFVLLESAARKCAFIERLAAFAGISNVRIVSERAESYRDGLGRHDLVTARAVAALNVTAEYAAPLLRVGGTLVAWGGKHSDEAERAAAVAAEELGLSAPQNVHVQPFSDAEHRYLYVMSKVMETPSRFPRRPGVARKHPLGLIRSPAGPSDRTPR